MSETNGSVKNDTPGAVSSGTGTPATVQTVSNPLTMISVFASVAEGAGAAVLPFIDKSLHGTFIWFLIGFPVLLIILFFATLNFNNIRLYAPNDYDSDAAFMASNTVSDEMSQKMVEMTEAMEETIRQLEQQIKEIQSQQSVGKQTLVRMQESPILSKAAADIPEILDLHEFISTPKLQESKNSITALSKKLEETKQAVSQYGEVTRQIQKLHNNPRQLVNYLAKASVGNAGRS